MRPHHSRRKPLAKWCAEKQLILIVQSAGNSVSQWATWAIATAKPRKSRENTEVDIFSSKSMDLLAEREGLSTAVAADPLDSSLSFVFRGSWAAGATPECYTVPRIRMPTPVTRPNSSNLYSWSAKPRSGCR